MEKLVKLKNKGGETKSFPFQHAEAILLSKNNLRSKSWELADDKYKLGNNGLEFTTDKGSNTESNSTKTNRRSKKASE